MKHRKLQVFIKMDIWEIWPTIARRYNEFKTIGKRYRKIFLGIIYHKGKSEFVQLHTLNPSILIIKVDSGKTLKNKIKKIVK